jgi:acyl carrier protein
MSKKLYNLISKVMSVEVFQINDESGPETIESWDSFHGLVLVDEIENNFPIKFTLEEIIDVKNVVDIKRHLKNHGVILDD